MIAWLLVEHRPAQLHLVIATRADPPLPLATLRARGDLVEVRRVESADLAADLAPVLAEVTR